MTKQDQDIAPEGETGGTGGKDRTLSVRVVDSLKKIDAATFDADNRKV